MLQHANVLGLFVLASTYPSKWSVAACCATIVVSFIGLTLLEVWADVTNARQSKEGIGK